MKKTKYLTLEQQSGPEHEVRRNNMTFDEACEAHPELVSETDGSIPHPRWGHAHYIEGSSGEIRLAAENWDTSG
jgi:hypothetical protein